MKRPSRRQLLQGSVAVAGCGLLAGCGLVSFTGERPNGPRQIGYLQTTTAPSIELFQDGLRGLGYVVGEGGPPSEQNLLIESRYAEGNLERLQELAAELVDLRVEVILARDTPAALALSRATSSIPIVAVSGAGGLVTNVAHPEGNITGLSPLAPAIAAKWVQLLHDVASTISPLATVSDPSSPSIGQFRSEAARAAQLLQIDLLPQELGDLGDLTQLSAVLSTIKAAGANGLVVLSGGVLGGSTDPRIGDQVLSSGLASIADQRVFAATGGLLAYGPIREWGVRRSVAYVDKILKGAKPADLPIETPTQFDLFVNVKTAQTLGLTIPQSVLQQATEIIQ